MYGDVSKDVKIVNKDMHLKAKTRHLPSISKTLYHQSQRCQGQKGHDRGKDQRGHGQSLRLQWFKQLWQI